MNNTITQNELPQPVLQRNDKRARWLIWIVSIIVFIAVALLSNFKLKIDLPFNVHVFALINAVVNSCVSLLLVAALIAAKKRNFVLHKNIMLWAIALSVIFLLSYICHHLLAGETKFGDINHDGVLSADEKVSAGSSRMIYYIILATHIPLAAIILPFILFTAYRALSGEYQKHKKLARITWPIWFYVTISGVLVYYFIHPYYN
ncbi:MAG: hypothetical protein NVSMB45_07080 [Ginsengibacter sp.]